MFRLELTDHLGTNQPRVIIEAAPRGDILEYVDEAFIGGRFMGKKFQHVGLNTWQHRNWQGNVLEYTLRAVYLKGE